ncbi:MAG: hypothetical protein U1A78_27840 [Polyangia bacterium]
MRASSGMTAAVRVSLVGAVVGTVGAAGPAAWAAKVAVLPPKVDSDAPVSEGKKSKFHDTLTQGLSEGADARTQVVPADEVRRALEDRPDLSGCLGGPCIAQAASAIKAERIVVPRVSIKGSVGGSAYSVSLTVFDASGTALPIVSSERCGDETDGCNLSKAYDAMKRATAAIGGQVSNPSVAEKLQPPAPTEPQLKDPTKDPAVGSDPTRPATSEPLAMTSRPPQPYRPYYRYGWIAAAIAGGAFVVSSIPFLVFASREGQTNCGPNVPFNQCPQVYQGNLAPGLGLLLGGGLASAGAFAVLFYLDKREQRRAAGTLTLLPVPLADGMALSAAGRF